MNIFNRFNGCKACGNHTGYEPKVGDYVEHLASKRSGEVLEVKKRWGVLAAKVALKPTSVFEAKFRWVPAGVLKKRGSD